MKVLVIEDTREVLDIITLCLSVRWPDSNLITAQSGATGLNFFKTENPDLVLLDLGLPDIDGMDVLEQIRKSSTVPIIIVTGRGEEKSRVKGLEGGADDYIVKPFSHNELLARIRAVMRRGARKNSIADDGVVKGSGISIDFAGHILKVDGQEVSLAPTEWNLLAHLASRDGKVATHKELAESVWGVDQMDPAAIKMPSAASASSSAMMPSHQKSSAPTAASATASSSAAKRPTPRPNSRSRLPEWKRPPAIAGGRCISRPAVTEATLSRQGLLGPPHNPARCPGSARSTSCALRRPYQ
ncbi:MAG: response regulator transcription factor [Chloroflexi bacterium]|nr:response regulator transcription factor [Chloroflexota bacterium]